MAYMSCDTEVLNARLFNIDYKFLRTIDAIFGPTVKLMQVLWYMLLLRQNSFRPKRQVMMSNYILIINQRLKGHHFRYEQMNKF